MSRLPEEDSTALRRDDEPKRSGSYSPWTGKKRASYSPWTGKRSAGAASEDDEEDQDGRPGGGGGGRRQSGKKFLPWVGKREGEEGGWMWSSETQTVKYASKESFKKNAAKRINRCCLLLSIPIPIPTHSHLPLSCVYRILISITRLQ